MRSHVLLCSGSHSRLLRACTCADAGGPSVPHFSSSWETIARAASRTGLSPLTLCRISFHLLKEIKSWGKKKSEESREISESKLVGGGGWKEGSRWCMLRQILRLQFLRMRPKLNIYSRSDASWGTVA